MRIRAPDKVQIFISKMHISSLNPMFDYLLESSHRDDSNKWSNIGFSEEIIQIESIEVHFTHLIWSSACGTLLQIKCMAETTHRSISTIFSICIKVPSVYEDANDIHVILCLAQIERFAF